MQLSFSQTITSKLAIEKKKHYWDNDKSMQLMQRTPHLCLFHTCGCPYVSHK